MEVKYYQIDEVAKLAGTSKRTIRYYEDLELLKPARTEASYRIYTEADIEVIKEIRNLRIKLGMNLVEIQHFMGLRKNIHDTLEGKTTDINKINEVESKIEELMLIVDEREKVLKRIKNNCNTYLYELKKIVKQLEEK